MSVMSADHERSYTSDDSTTGAAGASSGFASAAGASVLASPSTAGFSRGATGAGSSILGGFSSTLVGAASLSFGLVVVLKNSPTRADNRRPTLVADGLGLAGVGLSLG